VLDRNPVPYAGERHDAYGRLCGFVEIACRMRVIPGTKRNLLPQLRRPARLGGCGLRNR
jgi:hypothetical protein